LAGYNASVITSSFSNTSVTGASNFSGGLTGVNYYGTITNSYATGSVTGRISTGGLAGENYGGTILTSYSTGRTTSSDDYLGGLVGRNRFSGVITNCFYDRETSGQSDANGTPLYTISMVKSDSFTNATWNFTDTWTIVPNLSYPLLRWQTSDTPYAIAYTVNSVMSIPEAGSITLSANRCVKSGTISITANSNFGYAFDSWVVTPNLGTLSSTTTATATYTFTDTNVTITGYFRSTIKNWYVSDGSGNDNNGGTSGSPFKTITKALSLANPGDTINIAAGTYSETVVITQNNITIIGADSGTTIIDPVGDSTTSGLYGIYANGFSNLRISNLRIKNCYYGIYFNNVDTSVLNNVWTEYCGGSNRAGIYLYDGSDSNLISNCYANNNYNGIYLNTNCKYNTLNSNISKYNANNGYHLTYSSNYNNLNYNIASNNTNGFVITYGGLSYISAYNNLTGNTSSNNGIGFYLSGTSGEASYIVLTDNLIDNNTNGVSVSNLSNINFINNTSSNNTNIGFSFYTSGSNNFNNNRVVNNNTAFNLSSFSSSNFYNNYVYNNRGSGFYLANCSTLKFKMNEVDSNAQYAVYITGAGNNNIFTDNNFIAGLTYQDSFVYNTINSAVNFTNNYLGSSDSVLLSSKIKGTYPNQIQWSPYRFGKLDIAVGADTIAPDSITTFTADTSVVGQITLNWTAPNYGSGALGGTGLAGYNIFRAKASELTNGDTNNWQNLKVKTLSHTVTSWIDNTISSGELYYYKITAFDSHYTNSVLYNNESWYSSALIARAMRNPGNLYVDTAQGSDANSGLAAGAGSAKKTINGALAIAITGDTINIAVGTYCETIVLNLNNISLIGADSATTIIDPVGDSTTSGLYGISAAAKNNIRISNLKVTNCYYGIYFNNVDNSVISNVTVDLCNGSNRTGIYLYSGSDSNTISNCYTNNNYYGIYMNSNCKYNNLNLNISRNNTYGYYLKNNCNYNTLTENISSNNLDGFTLAHALTGDDFTLSGYNNLTSNTSSYNTNYGFKIYGNSQLDVSYNVLRNNLSEYNAIGIYGSAFRYIDLINNRVLNNTGAGISLNSMSNLNLNNNYIYNNNGSGLSLTGVSSSKFLMNEVDSNTQYALNISGSGSGNIFTNNNFIAGAVNTDSLVFNSVNSSVTFTNNYLGLTDSAALAGKINGTYSNQIQWQPFRFEKIDITIGADTIAPATPANLSYDTSSGSVVLSWTKPTLDDNGGTLTGLNGYKIYRSTFSDTNNWEAYYIGSVNNGNITSYTDNTALAPDTYYYRITAFDSHYANGVNYKNISWYSLSLQVKISSSIFYVNALTGADTNNGIDTATPFKTIYKALSVAASGGKIYIAAGTYSESVVITKNDISLIGADSSATIIDPPGDSNTNGVYGITANGFSNLRISGLRITGCYYAVYFNNVDSSVINNLKIDFCGGSSGYGIYLINGSCSNTISNNYLNNNYSSIKFESSNNNLISNNVTTSNQSYGVYLYSSSNNILTGNTSSNNNGHGFRLHDASNGNTLTNNISSGNNGSGIQITTASNNNILTNNFCSRNIQSGFYISSSHNNILTGNTSSNNIGTWGYGYLIAGSVNNSFTNNTSDSNESFGFYLTGASSADTFNENNWIPSPASPDKAVYNLSNANFDFRYNYWSSTDSAAISSKMQGDYASKIMWYPFRFSLISNTSSDTIAPNIISTISADTSVFGRITVSWDTPSYTGALGGTGIAGYNIFRAHSSQLTNGDTNDWHSLKIGTVSHGVTTLVDANVSANELYYYRITAFDSHYSNGVLYNNESWYSTAFAARAMRNPANLYVDTGLGNDANSGLASGAGNAKKTINGALAVAISGDTINIANGIYKENIVINLNNISLIGADSGLTIINPNGDTTEGNYGITATNKSNLTIKNLHITKCYYGVYFSNVDSSVIENVTVDYCNGSSRYGIYIIDDSDSNTIINCHIFGNGNGIYINSASGSSDSYIIANNKVISNDYVGILLSKSNYNVITGNIVNSNQNGIYLSGMCSYHLIENNTANSNSQYGIYINSASNYNIIRNNTSTLNTKGIYLNNNSGHNTINSNNFSYNNQHGIHLQSSSNNEIIGNIICNNAQEGINLATANINSIRGNAINNNNQRGIIIQPGLHNFIAQNDIKENTLYQIAIFSSSSTDTFFNNNIKASSTNPDSNIWNASNSGNYLDFRYNYWNISDSAVIANSIKGSASDKIIWQPFRLSEADTTVGSETADIYAPASTSNLSADTSVGGVILSWTKPALDENGGALTGLNGYNIYRSAYSDTNNWQPYFLAFVNDQNITSYTDNSVTPHQIYYYRITAFDSHYSSGRLFINESMYSSIVSAVPRRIITANIYVDTIAGSDANAGFSAGAGNAKKTINGALAIAISGDTINIAAGTYCETIVLSFNNISIIGADSVSTIINAGDTVASSVYGIYASGKNNLRISNLKITNAYYGIFFENTDSSVINNSAFDACGFQFAEGAGIYLNNGSDSNIVSNCSFINQKSDANKLENSHKNILTNNYGTSTEGRIISLMNSTNNILQNNYGLNNYTFYYAENSDNNSVLNNISLNCQSRGFTFYNSNNNIVSGNTSNNALGFGFEFDQSNNNRITGNTASNGRKGGKGSVGCGFYLGDASNNYLAQNTADSNVYSGYYINGNSSSNTFENNNFIKTPNGSDSAFYYRIDSVLNIRNNYFSTTDSAVISSLFYSEYPDKLLWSPFRLTIADTEIGKDTIPPNVVSTISFDTSIAGQIRLNWTQPGFNGAAGGIGLAGYNIFRAKQSDLINGDTNNWYLYKLATVDWQLTTLVDTGISMTDTYYYRITAFDKHTNNGVEFRNESWYSEILRAIPLRNRAPELLLPVSAMTVLEDTPVFTITFTADNIKDSDANDTIGNISLSVQDTDLVRIVISENGLNKTVSFYLLSDTFGVDTIIFKITDAAGASDSKVFALTILNVNDTPVIISIPPTNSTQGISYSYQTLGADMDIITGSQSTPINWQLATGNFPLGMTISETGAIYWIPSASQVGANTVTVLAGDGIDTAMQIFVIIVANVNDAPNLILSNSDTIVLEDCQPFYIDITAANVSDSDANDTIGAMTISVYDTQLVNAVVANNGAYHRITFAVLPDTFGIDTVIIRVTDSSSAYAEKPFVITISNVNDTPYFISQMNTRISSRVSYSFIQTAGDIDDTRLIISSNLPLPNNCSIIAVSDTSSQIDWLPAEEGVETISLRVTDAAGAYAIVNYIVTISDGPRKVSNIKTSYNSDSGVKLSWDAPIFNNVSIYSVVVTDISGNTVYTINYDSSVKTCNISASNFELGKDYKLSIIVTDAKGNASAETPAATLITYKPEIREIAQITGFSSDLNGKKIFIDNASVNNTLLIPVNLPANISGIDYIYIEYKNSLNQNWQIADLINYSNDRISIQTVKDNIAAGLWDLNANNISEGIYDLRLITVYKNGTVDTSSSIMMEFTASKTDAEFTQKFDNSKDTAFIQIKSAVGAETIVQLIPDVKTINGQEVYKNVKITVPFDLISADSRQQIYGSANGYDSLIIEKIDIIEAGDTVTQDSKLASMNSWDFEAAIIRVQLLRYNYSETKPFDKPVTIEIPYFDEDNDGKLDNSVFVNENTLKAFYKQNANDSVWKEVPTTDGWSVTYDYANNKAVLKVKHFTIYALFGIKKAPPSADLNNVVVFPNPFRPNDGNAQTGTELFGNADIDNAGGIHIKGLTVDCSIEIFDILGRKVSSLTNITGYGMAIWDARDDRGRKVGSGTYFIVIKGNGQTVVKKAAVIR